MLASIGAKPRLVREATGSLFRALSAGGAGGAGDPVSRAAFEAALQGALRAHGGAAHAADVPLATALASGERTVAVLLCGTSGTGKSTLASLVAARLGLTGVLATDSVRHMLASLGDDPLLHASTYAAHEALPGGGAPPDGPPDAQRVVRGYKSQTAHVLPRVQEALSRLADRGRSAVVEGIHLRPRGVREMARALRERGMTVVPLVLHVPRADKHRDRFSVRARHMSLQADANRYVRHFSHIRTIQEYLLRGAGKHAIPVLKNSSTDRSVALVHSTVLGCLRHVRAGGDVCDAAGNFAGVLAQHAAVVADLLGTQEALQAIRASARGRRAPGAGAAGGGGGAEADARADILGRFLGGGLRGTGAGGGPQGRAACPCDAGGPATGQAPPGVAAWEDRSATTESLDGATSSEEDGWCEPDGAGTREQSVCDVCGERSVSRAEADEEALSDGCSVGGDGESEAGGGGAECLVRGLAV